MKEQLQKGIVMVFAALSLLVVSFAFGGGLNPQASLLNLRFRTQAPVNDGSNSIVTSTNLEIATDPPALYLGQPSTQVAISPSPTPTSTTADSIPWFPSPSPTVTVAPSGSPSVVPSTKPTTSPTPSPTDDYRCTHGVINSRCQITPLPIISPRPSNRPSPVVSFQPIVNPDPLPTVTIPPLPEPCLPPGFGVGDWFRQLFGLSVPARCRVVPNPIPCPKPVGFGKFISFFKPSGCLISQVEPTPSPKVTSHPNPNPSESPIPLVSPSPGSTPATVPDVIRFVLRLPDNRNQDVTFEANHRATLYRYDNPASPRLVTKTAQVSVKQNSNGERYVDFSGGDLSSANLINYCVELQFRFKTNSPAYQNGYKASTYLAYSDSEYQIGNGVFSYNKGGGQKTVYGSGYYDTTAGRTTFCPSQLVR